MSRAGFTPRGRALALLLAALPASVRAQEAAAPSATAATAPDRELTGIAQDYTYGKYKEVLERARDRIDRGSLTEEELIELHKYAGLAAFHLNLPKDAERHLSALLHLDPDLSLDPYVFAPPAIAFFEKLRKQLANELEAIRQDRRLFAARRRREEEEHERAQVRAEEERRRIEALTRKLTIRTVEKRSFLVNFIPFGAGQFQQGRTTLGTLLAISEGLLAATSVVGFFVTASLNKCEPWTVPNVQTQSGSITFSVCGIPEDRQTEADVWTTVKTSSGIGFYALYAYGVIDALYRHKDEVVTVTEEQLPAPAPSSARDGAIPGLATSRRATVTPSPRLSLLPLPGGLGAGLTLHF